LSLIVFQITNAEELEMPDKLGELMVIVVDVRTGAIIKAVGIEHQNTTDIHDALDKYGFPADEETNYGEVAKELSKPADRCAFMLHTHSSPGCVWVFQDGSWRKVCN
jgi:hypothetical protein